MLKSNIILLKFQAYFFFFLSYFNDSRIWNYANKFYKLLSLYNQYFLQHTYSFGLHLFLITPHLINELFNLNLQHPFGQYIHGT